MAESDEPQIYKQRYKVDKKLGAKKFTTTYLVSDAKAKNELKVLKVVRLGGMNSEQTLESVREAELLSKLDDKHIVKFYESFTENDCLCIVTEYCEGDLDRHLTELKKQNIKLEEDQVVEWLIQILIAVQYMHKSRVLHRDLKARNIFLKSNRIKIGGFDISRIEMANITELFTGTPSYMAPESLKHIGYESKSDIWSVGCLLYEMCTYQHAFDGKDLMHVVYKIVEGKIPDIPKIYSKELNDLLKKIFIKEPKNRPSAAQLLQTPFIVTHRQRIKLNDPIENTVSESIKLNPINHEEMRKNSRISSKDYIPNDDDVTQSSNKSLNQVNEEPEREEQTLKAENSLKSVRQPRMARKIHDANPNRNIKQSWPPADDEEEHDDSFTNHARNPGQSLRDIKTNDRTGAPVHLNIKDRPLTPIRRTSKQIADQFSDEDNSQSVDNRSNDRSIARERELKNSGTKSASQRSMNQTINAFSSPTKPRTLNNPSIDDGKFSLNENKSNRDAFGSKAKDLKINNLRTKAIKLLGESTFEKVYDYLVKQRTAQKTNPNLDDAKITQGLRAIVDRTSDCWLVDQLVFLELVT